jgi:DNA repair protein RecO (recombination protein O)
MEWSDEAIVLSARRHGESSAIVTLMTREHGRHAGLVRGGKRAIVQPGNRVHAHWRARLAEHLGTFRCELTHAFAATLMDDPARLSGLSAACAMVEATMPERQQNEAVFDGLGAFLVALEGEAWPRAYVEWELGLLAEIGFGLDLSQCAATGGNDRLVYVSPKSGRAVSASAGEPYKDKLLALPAFLLPGGGPPSPAEVADGFRLTGYFLGRHVLDGGLPAARRRLEARLFA